MPKRRAAKSKPASKPRASWKGNLTFGLVSFPVEAFNALSREGSDIHFHQLHAECHRRIHHQKVCPVHGEVTNEEIVSGFEVSKDQYIEVDPDEIDALRTESERALTIDAFVAPDTIDPLYYDGRMYYLAPANDSAKAAYNVIVTAMQREEVYAVGQVVFSGKDQVVLVRVVDQVLHMAMLNYDAEIRAPEKVVVAASKSATQTRQIKLAQTLIRDWSVDDFDFSQYTDAYRERVEELIEAKKKGHKVEAPDEEDEEPETINLMEALKRSLNQPARQTKSRSKANHRA